MAPHSSTLAWKIPWTEEPGGLQSMALLRVGQDWATSLWLFTFMHWRRTWQPTPVSCLENPRDGGAWWAAVYGVAQSQTGLKRLSSSSSTLMKKWKGTSLLVQWLRLCTPNAGGPGSIPHAATKTWYRQMNKYFLKEGKENSGAMSNSQRKRGLGLDSLYF